MKRLILLLTALGMGVVMMPTASEAVVCARGVYREGCATARGAVVKPRAPVAAGCVYRAGCRVCGVR